MHGLLEEFFFLYQRYIISNTLAINSLGNAQHFRTVPIILSVMFAYLAFILCIRIIGICRPLLDINAYDIWDNLLLFFVRMLAVALLIALTQLIMHIFIEKIWIPITIALLLMTIPAHGGYNIYSGGVGWMWLGFNNCIGFMSDFTSYLKMLLVCFVLILITIVWKRR